MHGASSRASRDLPDPDRPPMAISRGRPGSQISQGQVEIARRHRCRGRRRILLRLGGSGGSIDMAADRGAHRQEQRQRRQPGGIAGVVEIAVQQDAAEAAKAAEFKVHDQEGEIVEHVDLGEGRIELDRIEQHGTAVAHDDVAQVQIAVAVADESLRSRRRSSSGATASSARCERAASRSVACRSRSCRIGFGEARRGCRRGRGPSPAAPPAFRPRLGVAVEAGDCVGQVFHGIAVEAALLGQLIEQGILVEALHFDHPVDRSSVSPPSARPPPARRTTGTTRR